MSRREVGSLGLGAWGGALAQGVCLYALGVLGALCAYAGYAIFALLVQVRAAPSAPMCYGVAQPVLALVSAAWPSAVHPLETQ